MRSALWQLCRGEVQVDTDPECRPKIMDILGVGLKLLFGGGKPVTVQTADGAGESVGSLQEFRTFVNSKLKEFAKGFLAVKNWQAFPEPAVSAR